MGCEKAEVFNPSIVADRIRRGLDVIGSAEGSLLYRGEEYWEVLPPGTDGQVLGLVDGLPAWQTAAGAPSLWTDNFFEGASPPTIQEVCRRYLFIGEGDFNPTIGIHLGLALFNGANLTDAWTIFCAPDLYAVRGTDQFSECKIGTFGSGHRCGLFVGANSDGQYMSTTTNLGTNSAYWVLLGTPGTAACQIQKITNGAAVTMGATLSTLALGDVCALTLEYGSGSNTIKFYVNGVLTATRTDSTLPFGRTGFCGFGGRGQALNQGMEFQNVRSGALSQL